MYVCMYVCMGRYHVVHDIALRYLFGTKLLRGRQILTVVVSYSIYMYVCMYVCMYACILLKNGMYVCMYVYFNEWRSNMILVQLGLCMYVCMYVYTHFLLPR